MGNCFHLSTTWRPYERCCWDTKTWNQHDIVRSNKRCIPLRFSLQTHKTLEGPGDVEPTQQNCCSFLDTHLSSGHLSPPLKLNATLNNPTVAVSILPGHSDMGLHYSLCTSAQQCWAYFPCDRMAMTALYGNQVFSQTSVKLLSQVSVFLTVSSSLTTNEYQSHHWIWTVHAWLSSLTFLHSCRAKETDSIQRTEQIQR